MRDLAQQAKLSAARGSARSSLGQQPSVSSGLANDDEAWITSSEFAQIVGIDPAIASRALKRRRYGGDDLDVRTIRGRGRGGIRYEVRLGSLPLPLKAKALRAKDGRASASTLRAASSVDREALWDQYERLPAKLKEVANERLKAVRLAHELIDAGTARCPAYGAAACQLGIKNVSTLRSWLRLVKGLDRADWLPALAPRWHGNGKNPGESCSPEAWDYFKADYLRLEQPAAEACYERLRRIAKERGWAVPSLATLKRRLKHELPPAALILARKGEEAIKRSFPHQERDRSVFHALQALNADGHRFDVFVKWPDGEIARPVMVAWQDLYSGKLLGYRVDRTENSDAVRLSFGDVVEAHGITDHIYLDNGRQFASKWMTGRSPTRYRFKIKEDDPTGIFPTLGIEVHWTTPYHGQSKPIERTFRDLCEYVAKHPAFAGAYTGNKPGAKPENYASRAIPLEKFLAVLEQEIVAHNARVGRRTKVCAGRSFDEAFAESYARSPIRKATAAQRRLWLLAAESVTASPRDGSVSVFDNRYYCDQLAAHMGQKVIVRFDPQKLHDAVEIELLDGRYVGRAQCIQAAGFNDTIAAREHGRARRQYIKATRQATEAARRMSAIEAAELLPKVEPTAVPQSKIVRPVFQPTSAERDSPETTRREKDFGRAVGEVLARRRREAL